VLNKPAQINPNWNSDNPDPASSSTPYRIYNIGNNRPIELMNYIEALEFHLGKKANKELLPMQPGDVHETFADIDDLIQEFDYKPRTNIEVGIKKFVDWYVEYYNKKTN